MNHFVWIAGQIARHPRSHRGHQFSVRVAAFYVTLIWGVTCLEGGQTGCGNAGPDVVLADIQSFLNYTAAQGIDAFSFGNWHCNIGDEPVAYMFHTNAHPVYGFNMYRLRAGRFEQIGMSWLGHGFMALNGNVCQCGCIPTNGTALGIGCSTPESANIQGQSTLLGPRSEVNAFTGYFPYPFNPGDPSSSPASVYKRLQVKLVDLDPSLNSSAQYFVEGLIVSADDAQAGNAQNNATHRPIVISFVNNDAFAAFAGPVERQKPAIRAWAALDPEVVISEVHVPDDGMLLLGAKAVYAGDGYWTYEYALYNHNMHRSVRAFHVPVPPGVAIDNVGFHDVDYHSGEPYDGTDWLSTLVDQTLQWETDSFEVHPNANALRWGTLYNFRFRTTRAPAFGLVTLSLFRPGTPTSITASTLVPSDVLPDCNDNGIDDVCDVTCLFDGGSCAVPDCGTSADVNLDGTPDECAAIGDVNADGYIDLADFAAWSGCALGPDVAYPFAFCEPFDVNGDDDVDLRDLRGLMNSFRPAGP